LVGFPSILLSFPARFDVLLGSIRCALSTRGRSSMIPQCYTNAVVAGWIAPPRKRWCVRCDFVRRCSTRDCAQGCPARVACDPYRMHGAHWRKWMDTHLSTLVLSAVDLEQDPLARSLFRLPYVC
jgi:hypothetical protein